MPPVTEYDEHDLRDAEAARVDVKAAGEAAEKEATEKRDRIVRALLKQPGWTMERVAKQLGVTRGWVNEINRRGKAMTTQGETTTDRPSSAHVQ